jgi:hypothetical protein
MFEEERTDSMFNTYSQFPYISYKSFKTSNLLRETEKEPFDLAAHEYIFPLRDTFLAKLPLFPQKT